MRLSVISLAVVVAASFSTGCEIAAPFDGPGWDSGTGEPTIPSEDGEAYFVSLTHLTLNEGAEASDAFNRNMEEINAVLDDQPGLVGYSLRTELFGLNSYTMTVWESEAASLAWVVSDVHTNAIVELADKTSRGETTHFEMQQQDLPPNWDDALQRLATDGEVVY